MEITFRDEQNENLTTIVLKDKRVFIMLSSKDKFIQVELDKVQLKDYIGALLHVQSKLNK